jgi:hypothetical protein
MKAKLGLDPRDTTAKEFYHALQSRLKEDDRRLTRALQTRAATYISAEGNVEDGIVHALQAIPESRNCFAIKPASFRTIIKKSPPKKAMKALGYRSLASFLKHETPVTILTVASATEDSRWQQSLLAAYKKLKPSDFETRPVAFVKADCAKWQSLAAAFVADRRHTILCFKELGAIVFMPFPESIPQGSVTASLSIAVLQLNEISAASTFLKMSQVKANFGSVVQTIVMDEVQLNSKLLDRPVPWHLIQRYYSRLKEHFNETVFEPHIQIGDMTWHAVEHVISSIEPSLSFWHDSSHLGMQHLHKPVSCNIVDVALNVCNNVPFEKRLVHNFQHSLWHELLLRYLHHDAIEQTVLHELQPVLASEYALA